MKIFSAASRFPSAIMLCRLLELDRNETVVAVDKIHLESRRDLPELDSLVEHQSAEGPLEHLCRRLHTPVEMRDAIHARASSG